MRLALAPSRRFGALVVAACLPLVLLAACADSQKEEQAYRNYASQWVGKPVAQLTSDWGPPDYETTDRGLRELQYNYSEAISWGQRPIYIGCFTHFLVDGAGKVQSVDISGNACSTRNSGPAARGR